MSSLFIRFLLDIFSIYPFCFLLFLKSNNIIFLILSVVFLFIFYNIVFLLRIKLEKIDIVIEDKKRLYFCIFLHILDFLLFLFIDYIIVYIVLILIYLFLNRYYHFCFFMYNQYRIKVGDKKYLLIVDNINFNKVIQMTGNILMEVK